MCVLLVEDEALIRLMMAEELCHEGFEFQEAGSGDEAVRIIEDEGRAYSLLITDIHMPGTLDGGDVARHFRAKHPGMPVVFVSGRPDALAAVEKGPRDAQLAKPFTPEQLMRLVRERAPKPALS